MHNTEITESSPAVNYENSLYGSSQSQATQIAQDKQVLSISTAVATLTEKKKKKNKNCQKKKSILYTLLNSAQIVLNTKYDHLNIWSFTRNSSEMHLECLGSVTHSI